MTLLELLNVSKPFAQFDIGKKESDTIRLHGTTTAFLMLLSDTALQSKVVSITNCSLDEIIVDLDLLNEK